jgi:hypothetical protein
VDVPNGSLAVTASCTALTAGHRKNSMVSSNCGATSSKGSAVPGKSVRRSNA